MRQASRSLEPTISLRPDQYSLACRRSGPPPHELQRSPEGVEIPYEVGLGLEIFDLDQGISGIDKGEFYRVETPRRSRRLKIGLSVRRG